MTVDKGAMPLLEQLCTGPCPQFKEMPSGIQHLKHLNRLCFYGMSKEFTQRLSGEQGEDYWIVKHAPILQYDGTYDPYGAWVNYRSDSYFKELFSWCGLHIYKSREQKGLPKELFLVKMYALTTDIPKGVIKTRSKVQANRPGIIK